MVGSEVIELIGDLGVGKTTLTQGILEGFGYQDEAPSPTFTLSRVYPVREGLELHHFDLYRLSGHDVVSDELAEIAGAKSAITVVEWADHGQAQLPADHLKVELQYGSAADDRKINFLAGGRSSAKLIQDLRHATVA